MDGNIILIFLALSVLAAVVFFLFFRKRPTRPASTAAADYADALNLLLEGDNEAALRKLKESVSKNSQNIDAYLKMKAAPKGQHTLQ